MKMDCDGQTKAAKKERRRRRKIKHKLQKKFRFNNIIIEKQNQHK
jgi:hypothetical protein